jgi:glycosyltransferase involved in cell wall biosynthesis
LKAVKVQGKYMSKKKILMISDHCLSSSGVGTQSRYLISGLLSTGKYQFFCLGGALQHANYDLQKVSDDWFIKPIDGFGNEQMIMQLLSEIKPDALLLFTDPRFFGHIWKMSDVIHQFCPIIYNTIWDNYPVPTFNKAVYESCDTLNCINDVSYNSVNEILPHYKELGLVNYIPHGVPAEIFYPMSKKDQLEWKIKLLGTNRADHLVGLFVSRNARRKVPSDVIFSWKLFLDELEKKYGHRKATLLMHTDPFDQEGPNLLACVDKFGVTDNVVFSKDRTNFQEVNVIYNVADFVINISSAEGFGLSLLEAKMAGKIGVALKTGGLTKQIFDEETQTEFGVAIEPEVRTLVGTQGIPWIYETYASHETYKNAFMKIFEMTPQEREELGMKALEHAKTKYSLEGLIKAWDQSFDKMFSMWDNKQLPNSKKFDVTSI